MDTKNRKSLISKIPTWGLSLITAFISLFALFVIAYGLDLIPAISDNLGEIIAYIIYNIIIATACFFICRRDPNSIWYTPVLSNIMGIISAAVEPNFWITALWIFMCSGWVLSIITSIIGARASR